MQVQKYVEYLHLRLINMKKFLLWLLCLLPFYSCGRPGERYVEESPDAYAKLQFKYDSVPLDVDSWGFVDTGKCDSTLFTGMISAGGKRADLVAAEVEPGKWYRRPIDYPECWEHGKSRSTISRDMLLGVYWHAWVHEDRDMLERLWEYGENNFWRMGDGRLKGADTVMNSAMISTLAQMIYALGGENRFISRNLPVVWSTTTEDGQFYVNRLTALHLLLRKEAYGELSVQAEAVLDTLVNKWPSNPLFLYAAGYKSKAVRVLNLGWEDVPTGTHSTHEYIYEWTFVAGRLLHERE